MIVNSFFTKNGAPATGLSPIIDIWDITDTTNTQVVTTGTCTEIGSGFYKYVFPGYDSTQNYVMLIDGGVSQPTGERYNISATQSVNVATENISQITSSVAAGVWEETATNHTNIGTTGLLLNQIGADTSATNLNVNTALSVLSLLIKYERNRTRIDKLAMTLTVYDDDNLTPIRVFNLKDETGQPSVTSVFERMPV